MDKKIKSLQKPFTFLVISLAILVISGIISPSIHTLGGAIISFGAFFFFLSCIVYLAVKIWNV